MGQMSAVVSRYPDTNLRLLAWCCPGEVDTASSAIEMHSEMQAMKEIETLTHRFAIQWLKMQNNNIQANRKCVLEVVKVNGWALTEADPDLRADEEIILAAMRETKTKVWEYVDRNAAMWSNEDFVSQIIEMLDDVRCGEAFSCASNELRNDERRLKKVLGKCGININTSVSMKDMVLEAVNHNGMLFGCASDELRLDIEVAKKAIAQSCGALRFANPSIIQNPTILEVAGVENDGDAFMTDKTVILSVQLCLCAPPFTSYAVEFVRSVRVHKYFQGFKPFNPHLRSKAVSFERHQEECKRCNGFMIQVEENEGLSREQTTQAKMADQMGLKVFRTFTNKSECDTEDLAPLETAVRRWTVDRERKSELEEVWIGRESGPEASLVARREMQHYNLHHS